MKKLDLHISLVQELNAAIKSLNMYPPQHPAVIQSIKKPLFTLQRILEGNPNFILSLVEDKLIANGETLKGDSVESLLGLLQKENIRSIVFTQNLREEDLHEFLSFFMKDFKKKSNLSTLEEFLTSRGIRSIKVNQTHYELVSEDEKVVSAEVLDSSDLKSQLSTLIKENPKLVVDILSHGPTNVEKLKEKFGKEKIGTGIDLDDLVKGVQEIATTLSDDEILSLIAEALKLGLPETPEEHKLTAQNGLELVEKLLKNKEKNERKRLLPQIKNMLVDYGVLDEKTCDLLFNKRWLENQQQADELLKALDQMLSSPLEKNEVNMIVERFFLGEQTEKTEEGIDKLIEGVLSQNSPRRQNSSLFLNELTLRARQLQNQKPLTVLEKKLKEKIQEESLSPSAFVEFSSLLQPMAFFMVEQKRFSELSDLLKQYKGITQDQSCSPEKRKMASHFLSQVGQKDTVHLLVEEMVEKDSGKVNKTCEEILQLMGTEEMANRLVEVFTVDSRTVRLTALRILGRLGKISAQAISRLLSDKKAFQRESKGGALVMESWYKMRNAVFVLGNLGEEMSIDELTKLKADPDPRVRMEVVKALEKIPTQKSAELLLGFFKDPEDEVRRKAIAVVTLIRGQDSLPLLIDHFYESLKDKAFVLPTISKIGGEKAKRFLLEIISAEEISDDLSSKQKEEIQIAALHALEKSPTPEAIDKIQQLLRSRKKGIKKLWAKDQLAQTAEKVLENIKR